MSCYICNKSFSRLRRHLKEQHKSTDVCIEPRNLGEFAIMLSLTPIPKEFHSRKNDIQAYINESKDLPKDLYCILEKYFQKYKSIKGLKPILNIAKHKRIDKKLCKTKRKKQPATTNQPNENCVN